MEIALYDAYIELRERSWGQMMQSTSLAVCVVRSPVIQGKKFKVKLHKHTSLITQV